MTHHEGRRKDFARHGILTAALLWVACACFGLAQSDAATPLSNLRLSPDVSIALNPGYMNDDGVVMVNAGGVVGLLYLGSIPVEADVTAYHLLPNGHQLYSLDTTVVLNGTLFVTPGDVVRFDAVANNYWLQFQAAAAGLPAGVNVDAVSMVGPTLLLSFDGSLNLNGVQVDDEDLVLYDGTDFTMFFDGSVAVVDPDLDLDAAQYVECNDHLLLSFDGSGVVDGQPFDDEDVLEYDRGGNWEMSYDGSAHHSAWSAADLDALHATVDPGPGPALVFGQEIVQGASPGDFVWPNPVAWKAVRGAVTTLGDVGAYQVDLTFHGFGTVLSDPSVPPAGTGYWYLVKPVGCALTSWQSTLGAEPGRDAALP